MAYFAFGKLLWGAWSALGSVVAARDLGGAAAWGSVLAAMGVGALAGSLVATQVRPRRPLVFVALTDGLFALPLAFLAAVPPVALLACGALLAGAGMMLGLSVWESTLQRHIPAESLSRISSYDWFGSRAFSPLGLVIWAPVGAAIGSASRCGSPSGSASPRSSRCSSSPISAVCPLPRHRYAHRRGVRRGVRSEVARSRGSYRTRL